MVPRASHIPHAIERSALQKLAAGNALAARHLHPAGTQTLARMVEKGWVERRSDSRY